MRPSRMPFRAEKLFRFRICRASYLRPGRRACRSVSVRRKTFPVKAGRKNAEDDDFSGVFPGRSFSGRSAVRGQKTKGLPGEPGRPVCAVVTPERVELSTYCLGGSRSIQLSYGVVLCSRYAEVPSVSTRRAHDSSLWPSVDNRRSVWKRIQARACALFFRRFSDEA